MSSCKKFKLIDTWETSSSQQLAETNWELCVVCQEVTAEPLTSPLHSKRKDIGKGYQSLAENLIKFDELGKLPRTLQLDRLNEGQGVEAALVTNKAKWHKTCRLRYNNQMLQRAEKREYQSPEKPHKCSRLRSSLMSSDSQELCFFCSQEAGSDGLHEVTTLQVDQRVRKSAELTGDSLLLAKLSLSDMVALEAKYHTKCLLALYNRARKAQTAQKQTTSKDDEISGIIFAELVMYIEEVCLETSTVPVFKLADMAQLYMSRMQQLGVVSDKRMHTTRLKQRLLSHFPDMRAQNKGRDEMLVFDKDIGAALDKACEQDSDSDAVHLARAAQIVRRHMFDPTPFTGSFEDNCQEKSVPHLLLSLVSMVLEGPSIKDQIRECTTPAALSIAQILKYNSVKHVRKQADTICTSSVRHSSTQETPLPVYIGLMLHAQTRKRDLVNRLFNLGLSISYDRVLCLSAEMGNSVCQRFHMEQSVCPPMLKGNIFTTAAVDNLDHNPSATTAKDSFHGTGISLLQHPNSANEGLHSGTIIIQSNAGSKTVGCLPDFYTDVPPITFSVKQSEIPNTSVISLKRNAYKKHAEDEYRWLENTRHVLEVSTVLSTYENISWAAYHAVNQETRNRIITPTALLPLFQESAHTVAMIRHSMDVVKRAVEHLNPGQTPVLTFDQPLFALAKQIQWKWPEKYGQDMFVIMFGGLHIEMAALKTIGDWLENSGWAQALVQAEITTAGIADSLHKASHVMRTRRAHQITAAALYILQHRAYDHYSVTCTRDNQTQMNFETWCDERKLNCPQFHYWATTMELELCILTYVRSLREANFSMYLDVLTELVPWFFALDHTNHARWIPVHLSDMAELPMKHPDIYREFNNGHFVAQKTKRIFSAIPMDQAHEQNNACMKGDGGAVGLTDNPSALRRWMISGPEIARVIGEFESSELRGTERVDTRHHDQTTSVQTSFAKDVCSLVTAIEELGNPFEEKSQDLLVLDTKEIAVSAVVNTVYNAKRIGQDQFNAFAKECLIDRTKSIDDTIHRNKLPLFGTLASKTTKVKQQLTSLKCDVELFSRLYIGCQTRDGNLDEFFRHENQACPPSLSVSGRLHLGTKSDMLVCLNGLSEAQSEAPIVSSIVIDGAAIVQMLKPGTAETFKQYAHQVFLPYISGQLQHALQLDLVWDSYVLDSLKATARAKRGKGICQRVTDVAPMPRNWQDFMRVDLNKKELFSFLSKALVELFKQDGKELFVTDGNQVLCVPQQQNVQ